MGLRRRDRAREHPPRAVAGRGRLRRHRGAGRPADVRRRRRTFAAINKGKSQAQASIGRGVDRLVLGAGPATLERFALVRDDVLAAARVAAAEVEARPDVADGTVDVLELELAPVAEASA